MGYVAHGSRGSCHLTRCASSRMRLPFCANDTFLALHKLWGKFEMSVTSLHASTKLDTEE